MFSIILHFHIDIINMVSLDTESNLSHHDHAVRARQGPIIMRCKGGILMAKKKYEVDVEKMKKTLWYRVSKFITDISIPVLYILAIGFALFRGVADKQNAAIYSEMSVLGADAFMKKLVEVSLLSTFCLYGINTFAKSAR